MEFCFRNVLRQKPHAYFNKDIPYRKILLDTILNKRKINCNFWSLVNLDIHIDDYERCAVVNPNITWDIIKAYPRCKWNWMGISQNPNITWDIIVNNLDNPDCYWDWRGISMNPNITWDIIVSTLGNPNYKWDWWCISMNPNITLDIIKNNLNNPVYKWNWYGISKNPSITWDIIKCNLDNPRYKWNWYYVSMNPNITWEIITTYPDYDWLWGCAYRGPDIQINLAEVNAQRIRGWDILES